MNKDTFDYEKEFQDTPKRKSYADLDLGLDFDLSFLDDIDESVLEEEPVKEEPVKKAPVKKTAPAEAAPKKAPAKKPAVIDAEAPVKKAPAKKAPVKKPESEEDDDQELLTRKSVAKKAAAKPAQAPSEAAPKKAKKQPAAQDGGEKPKKKKKKGPRVGGVIFYTLYFLFILAFFVAAYLGLSWLQGWLADYELAQPTVKAEQVYQEVFTDPDWGALYDSAGAQDSAYEGKEEYVAYMEKKVGDSKLTYLETSVGLAKDMKKYIVRLGSEKVASFTLVDKNKVGNVSLDNLENITDIPDWQLGAVEVFFEREDIYNIVMLDGYTAYVNGVALDDSFVIQRATTVAEDYLPEGTTGFSMNTLQVTGLMEQPNVTVMDGDNKSVEVTYDEASRTFTARSESNTMTAEQEDVALEAAKISSLWMIKEVTDRGKVAKYFDASSSAYNKIVKNTELWMQKHGGYEFVNTSVTNFAGYSDDIFSVRVQLQLNVTRTNGSIKEHTFDQSMFFRKSDSGKWLCFESTNVDVSQPVGKVRLTFKQGDNELTSGFVDNDAKEVVTPKIPSVEGQVFSGWVTISENEEGATVYNLEFQPDETGIVKVPEGTVLKPMTLYAFFQDESEVQASEDIPAETAPAETTEGE